MDIRELEHQIALNKHLPGIPSAKVIEEQGYELGDMQTKSMEKIEELTLYVIELFNMIESLKAENNELKEMINKIGSCKQ
jgi:hypothetical protein